MANTTEDLKRGTRTRTTTTTPSQGRKKPWDKHGSVPLASSSHLVLGAWFLTHGLERLCSVTRSFLPWLSAEVVLGRLSHLLLDMAFREGN